MALFAKKEKSTQQLIGIQAFNQLGLKTAKGDLGFFIISPTNISVLSKTSIETKIHRLMTLISAIPDIEICCLDACESFDDNKVNLKQRIKEELNPKVRALLQKDLEFLDGVQFEMSTARKFLFIARMRKESEEQSFANINRMEKAIAEQGFEVRRASKNDIKHFLTVYFGSGTVGEELDDIDGERWVMD